MEIIKNLIIRLRHSGVLVVIGLLLIIYIAFGLLYWQQGPQQRGLEKQISNLSLILSKPLPTTDKLQAEYEEVNRFLMPITNSDAIAMLVGIAEGSGIDTDEESDKFRVPSAKSISAKVGGGTYQLLSFSNIHAQGDYDIIMAFISVLDSGEIVLDSGEIVLMVLKRVATRPIEVMFTGEDADRRTEFRNLASSVIEMMDDNGLSEIGIRNPMSFAGGIATNLMGDDPNTATAVEGFPDISTTAAEKGYTGTGAPRDGYVLYEHDKISTDNTTLFVTVSDITTLTTQYYYTCEADGTVRQFDGADVATAMEYLGSDEFKIETIVTVDVDIYTKP